MTAKQFKSFLRRHGWSAYGFCQASGIPRSTVYRWAAEGVSSRPHILLIEMIDRYGLPNRRRTSGEY